ncbi:hypothetical protein VHEMI02590 [[Torrubiella] hemipterigena]|uniref:DUF3433 domain protein n=1 Tax=[Torrubiella] hemipterigena TaxID=1531966 RepID=A0A0A1SW81_9HYPO|nr:hypothetical protein VHEMI02590 [[Torrubiella] hemipterigena]
MDHDNYESGGSPYPRRAASSAAMTNDIDVLYDAAAASVAFDPSASTDSLQANFHRDRASEPPAPISGKTPTWTSSLSYASTKIYSPYSPLGESTRGLTRAASKSTRHSNYSYDAPLHQDTAHDVEESYDMALLSSAAPMGATAAAHDETMAHNDESYPLGFDVSSALGPFTPHDEEFLRKIQQQEASGHLTGGLGKGFRPDTRMRDADLMNSPTSPLARNLSRSFTQRLGRRMTRQQTLRNMGQEQANKTGQVIEVIVEDGDHEHVAGADLSFIEGANFVESSDFRRTETALPRESMTQIFYPQPNWKPWSIRWPYMTLLIFLSIGLAIMQEWLFQKYKKTGILQFTSPKDISPGLLFFIKFMPTLLGIVYGVLWQFADIEIRRLEPYFQLSKPGGALAAESISIDYVTLFNIFRPFYAIKNRHYIVATMSSAALFAMSLVPTFASATIVLEPSRQERKDPDTLKSLHIQPMWSRLLTSILAINALCGLIVFALLQTRRSGLQANVRGIAGLASMAVVSHILMDFKDMDTAKPKDIHEKLKGHRYMLQNSCLAPDNENPVTKEDREKYKEDILPQHPHPLILRAKCCIPFIIYIVFMVIFIPSFLFTDLGVVPEKAPWLVTLLSVVLKLLWIGLDSAVRTLEPYYILSKRHAPSKTLTLDYNAMPWGYMSVQALLNGHIFVFLVGFGSVMVEFLTLLVAGLASVDGKDFLNTYNAGGGSQNVTSGQETFTSFYVSVGFSMFILLYMIIVSTVVFIRRRHPFLPRQPTTIASVLAFIHQSKMLYNFVGTNKLSPAAMVRKLDDGKTYGLGWFEGRDGQMHCGIDQEELASDYKHGLDFTQGVRPWNMQWDVL